MKTMIKQDERPDRSLGRELVRREPPSRRRIPADRVGLYGLLIVAAVFAVFPLLWMLSGSLQTLDELLSNESFVPADPQWRNYLTGVGQR